MGEIGFEQVFLNEIHFINPVDPVVFGSWF